MKTKTSRWLLLVILLFIFTIDAYASKQELDLTEEEKLFIKEHPIIYLGVDPKFVPFEFFDNQGEYKGIAADYFELVSEKTGLQFHITKGLSWPEAYDLALNRTLDGLPAIGKTDQRERLFLFSDPYYYFKRVIVTRDTDKHIANLTDLQGSFVAVQRNSSHHSYLLAETEINLSLYDSVEAALTAVATGEEVAFVGNLATTNYLLRSHGLTNLRFIAFEAEKPQALYLAVRPDWPELISIFNKAIHSITDGEKAAINKKWIDLDTQFDYGPIIRIITIIVGIFSLVIAVSLFWIFRLRQEIAQRIEVQTKLESAHHETATANEQLSLANEELEKMSMIDGLTGITNRRYFDSFLQKLWGITMRERFPVGLIMIDIDNFKNYNDSYGHLAGDECLKKVASIIDQTVQRMGDFVCRYGGEEFAVLLSNTTEDNAFQLAEKIRLAIETQTAADQNLASSVTVSLGVAAMLSIQGLTPECLIEAADRALYKAKEKGRNRSVKASSLADYPEMNLE